MPPFINIVWAATVASGWAVTTTAKPAAEEIVRWLLSARLGVIATDGRSPCFSANEQPMNPTQNISSRTKGANQGRSASLPLSTIQTCPLPQRQGLVGKAMADG